MQMVSIHCVGQESWGAQVFTLWGRDYKYILQLKKQAQRGLVTLPKLGNARAGRTSTYMWPAVKSVLGRTHRTVSSQPHASTRGGERNKWQSVIPGNTMIGVSLPNDSSLVLSAVMFQAPYWESVCINLWWCDDFCPTYEETDSQSNVYG